MVTINCNPNCFLGFVQIHIFVKLPLTIFNGGVVSGQRKGNIVLVGGWELT